MTTRQQPKRDRHITVRILYKRRNALFLFPFLFWQHTLTIRVRIDKESHRNSRTSSGKEKVDKSHQQEQQSREACISTNVHPIYLDVQAHRVGRLKSVDTIRKKREEIQNVERSKYYQLFLLLLLTLAVAPLAILSSLSV
jgi:hypothetical protein